MSWIIVLRIMGWAMIACAIVLFGIVILESPTQDAVLHDTVLYNKMAVGGLSMIGGGMLLGFTNGWKQSNPLDNPRSRRHEGDVI